MTLGRPYSVMRLSRSPSPNPDTKTLVAAAVIAMGAVTCLAQDLPNPTAEQLALLAAVSEPERFIEVTFEFREGPPQTQRIRVRGSISDDDAAALARPHARRKDPKGLPTSLSVKGSEAIAMVFLGRYCGYLCGDGEGYVYERREGGWVLVADTVTIDDGSVIAGGSSAEGQRPSLARNSPRLGVSVAR